MTLEEFGRQMDQEIERLKAYVIREVIPVTGQRGAELLRAASQKLATCAEELDRVAATRRGEKAAGQATPEPK